MAPSIQYLFFIHSLGLLVNMMITPKAIMDIDITARDKKKPINIANKQTMAIFVLDNSLLFRRLLLFGRFVIFSIKRQ